MRNAHLIFWFVVLSGCGSAVTTMSSSRSEPDAATPDVQIVSDARSVDTVVTPDVQVEQDAGHAEDHAVVADAALSEDVSLAADVIPFADTALSEDSSVSTDASMDEDASADTDLDVHDAVDHDAAVDAFIDAEAPCRGETSTIVTITVAEIAAGNPYFSINNGDLERGWVPIEVRVNVPRVESDGTFTNEYVTYDLRSRFADLRCRIGRGGLFRLFVPVDFSHRPPGGHYFNYQVHAVRFDDPGREAVFREEWPRRRVYCLFGIYPEEATVALLGGLNFVHRDGSYETGVYISEETLPVILPYSLKLYSRSPWVPESYMLRIADFDLGHETVPRVGELGTEFSPSVVAFLTGEFARGIERVSVLDLSLNTWINMIHLYSAEIHVRSRTDGSSRVQSLAVYHPETRTCEDAGLAEMVDRSLHRPISIEFIPIRLSDRPDPVCALHIIGRVCPPGRPLLTDGHCGAPLE